MAARRYGRQDVVAGLALQKSEFVAGFDAFGKNRKPEAAAEAEHMTGVLHGENWRDQQSSARAPAIAPKAPAQPPPPGKIGVDAQGNRWRNVNGQAVLVPK